MNLAGEDGGRQPAPAGNKTAHKVIRVVDYMVTGQILEWKSLEEVAGATGLSRNEAYSILTALVENLWVEKSPKGFRANYPGLARYTIEAQECLARQAQRLGLAKPS